MSRKRVVIFISGGGSNMEALIRAAQAADFPAEIVAVFSDKAEAGGLARAQGAGVATQVFKRKDYASKDEHEDAILEALAALQPDIICLAGYMRLLSGRFIAPYEGRILNIHPSLLPLFPGLHTHQRALDAGMKVAGCTVHLVTEGMDEGPILAQAAVPVRAGDDAETLAARVLKAEHQLYAAALRKFAAGEARDQAEFQADGVIVSV
ncbi:phosphoribosylglycinamide formyltransferase [Brucella sp. ZJ1_1]|uniref:Phosphoribosylglycinamide formyltransferase n=2 Tax=Brucella intermedia TaxID=94625 RepID=M5JLP8_9HYPH|nr:phosphoribosylglycinamide formyltransferase [Brucella intermedia]HCH71785.1 phosphoribosylglycinamide formyltransferase [Ochrobactrum sp.]ELT47695.1 phosphoribosylglycinamide formyltransferase [Brucella intermedia M86]KAB2693292.1 phosphoribosylglycinamide formyltransferase [Brucella intermedia]MDH0126011.1 phosphoribosylglycinamide formyltransferase [Brucella intermedia GD04153]OOC51873.1 phosphoribosylglycinamide formyltransferase [Brucella intermedia M86]